MCAQKKQARDVEYQVHRFLYKYYQPKLISSCFPRSGVGNLTKWKSRLSMVEAGAGDAVVCESDDDEVIDLPLAPQGSAILLPPPTPDGAACRGIVVALDEPGMRMLVTIDETLEERWVGATEGWEL